MRLSPTLKLRAANYPGLVGRDVDFGATPLLYRAPGCPARLAVVNKSGVLLVYDRAAIAKGPRQRLRMSTVGSLFIGVPAYDPGLRLIFVNNPIDSRDGRFKRGLGAQVGADCGLGVAWEKAPGAAGGSGGLSLSVPPTVANGVVYAVRSANLPCTRSTRRRGGSCGAAAR